MIVSDDCGTEGDHDATQYNHTENTLEKNTVLIFSRNDVIADNIMAGGYKTY